MDVYEIGGIPVLARRDHLLSEKPVVIVIHGMSTTALTMRAGWPDTEEDGLTRVYWQLPVLREGRDAVVLRRQRDLFNDLFWPVVEQARAELQKLIAALNRPEVALFGFSIGGLISLWGVLDNPQVRASIAVGGVPYLEYLVHYFPDYDWDQEDVLARRHAIDLRGHGAALATRKTMVLHGLNDDQAKWEWMQPFSDALLAVPGTQHVRHVFEHVQHRLLAQDDRYETAQLTRLRDVASAWLRETMSK